MIEPEATFKCHVSVQRSAPHPCSFSSIRTHIAGRGLNYVVSRVLTSSDQPLLPPTLMGCHFVSSSHRPSAFICLFLLLFFPQVEINPGSRWQWRMWWLVKFIFWSRCCCWRTNKRTCLFCVGTCFHVWMRCIGNKTMYYRQICWSMNGLLHVYRNF